MRLIDADALDKRIYNDVPISTFGSIRRMAAVRELIEEAPTVEAAPRWHRVEDELPKYGQDVLAARLYGDDVDGWAYEIIIAHICNVRDSVYWNATNVTHWMHLPEPPKEEQWK